MHPVHDIFHRAMARTLQQSGNVEVVHGEPARVLVQAGGGLGARLRYRLPVPAGILSAAIWKLFPQAAKNSGGTPHLERVSPG